MGDQLALELEQRLLNSQHFGLLHARPHPNSTAKQTKGKAMAATTSTITAAAAVTRTTTTASSSSAIVETEDDGQEGDDSDDGDNEDEGEIQDKGSDRCEDKGYVPLPGHKLARDHLGTLLQWLVCMQKVCGIYIHSSNMLRDITSQDNSFYDKSYRDNLFAMMCIQQIDAASGQGQGLAPEGTSTGAEGMGEEGEDEVIDDATNDDTGSGGEAGNWSVRAR